MTPRPVRWALAMSVVLVLAALVAVVEAAGRTPPGGSATPGPFATPFSFGAAGDFSFSAEAQAVMTSMGNPRLDFVLALGDLVYGEATEAEWCAFFETQVGDGKAILIAGNHDEGGSDGHIDHFRLHCNFGLATGLTGDYGKEYYFDYPSSAPLARFILSSCGLDLAPGTWACDVGDGHYTFISDAIDGARAADIPWVIFGIHKNCISNGGKDCDIGEALQDLLLWKRVDLVLQGHEHAYLRTKRIVCADDDLFRPECIAPEGQWGQVINIVGTGGRSFEDLGGQADEPYFETWSGETNGFLRVDVTEAELNARYVPVVGTYTDSYQIRRAVGPPDFSLAASPASLTVVPGQQGFVTVRVAPMSGFSETVRLEVSAPAGVTGSCQPSSVRPGETATCTLAGSTPGSYTVSITGTGGSLVRSQDVGFTVAEPAPGPDATPPLIAIASPSDRAILRSRTVTVTGSASDNAEVHQVDLSVDGTRWTRATGTNSWSGTVILGEGEQRIHARATDASDNTASTNVTVFVDLTEPEPTGFLGLPWPTFVLYAAFGIAAVVAAVAAVAVLRSARRRRESGGIRKNPATGPRHHEGHPPRR